MRLRTTEIIRVRKTNYLNWRTNRLFYRYDHSGCVVGTIAEHYGLPSFTDRRSVAKAAHVKLDNLLALEIGFENYDFRRANQCLAGMRNAITSDHYAILVNLPAYKVGQKLAKLSGY